ncbi:Death-associated protein kinase 1-like protein [Dinothrombium tinctorium]|uniref:Alpha-latrotoxin n=1 Tax=Dinothrombium tinctorium TaxID=1965070 RepID=A0A3S3PPG4_9ACAR|nr:Death-associated protein kinase 1-like protein [Dinothrombium tinctorium]RWS07946.1 Death-associated protein kinase 1-like protein [Dinothrombium tinctorium]
MDKLYKSSPNLNELADTGDQVACFDGDDVEKDDDEERSGSQDENFVSAAIFAAIEDGNLDGIKELLQISRVDLNLPNKHGETAVHIASGLGQFEILKFLHSKGANIHLVDNHGDSTIYWSARQGHTHIIRFLYEHGVNVDLKNKIGETAIHVAARYGQAEAIEQLCRCGANINAIDDHGETALHIAVWHGFPKIVHVLGDIGANGNVRNKDDETPLHCAAARGHTESVRYLLEFGVDLNLLDKYGCTALHLALRRHHTPVALAFINAGCNIEISDGQGERPIHIAAREGLLRVCQVLCSLSCTTDVCNKAGLYPIHLAAKNGHTEIVRCLCLAGCQIDRKNRDGITAEISAISQGYNHIAELLNKISQEQLRTEYIAQLVPMTQPVQRIKLKFFGHSGIGKTTVIDSLKCGYFSSWFRRSSRSSNPNRGYGSKSSSKSSLDTTPPLTPTSETNSLPYLLTFNGNNEHYTKCVDIQQATISGIGDVSIWEFSGVENYYQVYDHFIGNTNCFHLIVFRLCDPLDVQIKQVMYWLYFLQSRLPIFEPLSFCGKSKKAAKVALIATHADVTNSIKGAATHDYLSADSEHVLQIVKNKFQNIFDIYDTVFVMDAHVVGSQAMKQLKQYASNYKSKIVEDLPIPTQFLHAVTSHLVTWRRSLSSFPVVSCHQFNEIIRDKINPLAGDEHIKELIQQLQVMGEILYLKGKADQDLIVLNPRWLTVDVIGYLLRPEYTNRQRITGCYSVDDIQLLFPDVDALDLLQVLEILQLCTQCDIEGDIEYEFASFIKLERPDGVWPKTDHNFASYCYGGVRLQCESDIPSGHLITCLFPRLQVTLRQCLHDHPDIDGLTLYQWCNGCKLRIGYLEAVIMPTVLTSYSYEAIEVRVRGPTERNQNCFYFFEDLLNIIETSLSNMCPSLILERHYYSPSQLREHKDNLFAYSPQSIIKAAMSSEKNPLLCRVKNEITNTMESLSDILCFGLNDLNPKRDSRSLRKLSATSEASENAMQSPGEVKGPALIPDLHVTNLTVMTKQKLCEKLDPVEPLGKDWCMLGVRLGLTDKLPKFDTGNNLNVSPTWRMLEECCREEHCTLKVIVKKLEELARDDVIDIIYRTAPILKIFPLLSNFDDNSPVTDESGIGSSGVSSSSQASSSNLSR